jgi:phosphonate transport system substrate-binding protein
MALCRVVLSALMVMLAVLPARAADLRAVVTAAFVSEQGLAIYDELAQYLGAKTGDDITTLSGLSYAEASLLLSRGIVQVGFICGLPYVEGRQRSGVQLLATPSMKASAATFDDVPGYAGLPGRYFSYTIVHKDAPYRSWQDLRGSHYVYNDQNSNSGYNMPRFQLLQLGALAWEDWFDRISVSGSHEESIRLVARGLADASSVDSLVLDYERARGAPDALNVKVIETLFPGGAGAPPVVVSATTPRAKAEALRKALINMHLDPAGRAILDKANIDRFLPAEDSNYDSIRKMAAAARAAGFRDHTP